MFKYHKTPLLDNDIALELQNAMLTQKIDQIPWILRYETHDYWEDELTEKYPKLIEFTVDWHEMNFAERVETDNLRIGNVFALAQYSKGDYLQWHLDYNHRKAVVVFLDDRTAEDGSFFEFENKPGPTWPEWEQWKKDNPDTLYIPEEKDIVQIIPKFNTWVEMDNPDGLGCWHRTSPNLSGKPRLALTIFLMNIDYS